METRKITELHNWEKNPRGIKKDDFQRLKRLILKLGIFKPFVITEDGTVLGGNMRLRAVRELVEEGKLTITDVPVVVADAPDEKTKIEYALADNDRVGYYEDQALAELLQGMDIELDDYKVDIGEPKSLKDLLAQFGPDVVEDEPPEVSDEPAVSKYGEVYQLGNHRLMCGDATKIEDVEKLMDGEKADMVFTDPPYGMDFTGSVHADGSKSHNAIHGSILNDSKPDDDFLNLFIASLRLFNRGSFYITYWRLGIDTLMNALTRNGLKWRSLIIWKKNNFNLSNSDFKSKYEPIIYGWEDDYEPVLYGWVNEHMFYGKSGENDIWELPTVWDIDRTQKNDLHATMKPVALPARAIMNSSKEGDIVLDLFGGSGSTLIASKQTNRICYMMELDPKYCDVIRKRYAKFIGKEEEWETITPLINKE